MATKRTTIRKTLVIYDFLVYAAVIIAIFFIHKGVAAQQPVGDRLIHALAGALCVFGMRFMAKVYSQVWRYGGIGVYMRLIIADFIACVIFYLIERLLLPAFSIVPISIIYCFTIVGCNLLLCMVMRMLYYYVYRWASIPTKSGTVIKKLLAVFGRVDVKQNDTTDAKYRNKIKLAIVGAGRVGVGLAEDLLDNPRAAYIPVCFIDKDAQKVGRYFAGIPVLSEDSADRLALDAFRVQEIAFAIPETDAGHRQETIKKYRDMGYKLKIYDYPNLQSAAVSQMQLREFEIEDVLCRAPVDLMDKETREYYQDKVVMVTGGGGSIGSEMCRQLASMDIKKLIILDIAENGAYEIQQDIRIRYGGTKNVCVEIVSVCDEKGLAKVFEKHHPDIIIHAAAHKHVPLMETNCVEAIKNNVFGTLNTVRMAEKYGAQRFLMVSTDKAVNPTNVMGATKRVCEMIVQSRAKTIKEAGPETSGVTGGSVIYSATRFGNVLGSAGSVVPLFKKQIAKGGPVTVTDKRIVRYFMTIPEACQLVLKSGPMAKSGELYVLDMGDPVKIIDLAENMIRLSGLEPYKDIEIIETGLRPGEKLYEELLVKSENVDATDDKKIFIERDAALNDQELTEVLDILGEAVASEDDAAAKEALRKTVKTYQ